MFMFDRTFRRVNKKPAYGDSSSGSVDDGQSAVCIRAVEDWKKIGNDAFRAGDYVLAAARYAWGLCTLDHLGTVHTRSSLCRMSWNKSSNMKMRKTSSCTSMKNVSVVHCHLTLQKGSPMFPR